MPGSGWRSDRRICALLLLVCLPGVEFLEARARKAVKLADEPAPASTPGRVADVRFWSGADSSRVAVEVTGEFEYRSDRLANPDRIFFDISGMKPSRFPKAIETIPVRDPVLKQIRLAETKPGTTRIVLDLLAPAEATASQLSNPNRLMIEIRPLDKRQTPAVIETTAKTFEPPPMPVRTPSSLTVAKLPPPKVELPAPTPSPVLERTAKETMPQPSAPVPPVVPAKRTMSGESSMTRVLGLKLDRVVLDPGHGGHDSGTCGYSGLLEKDLVLDVAKRLGALIQARLGSEVIYTREDDTFIPLQERTRIANRHKADLFLSIHANSSEARSASGIETYYLNFTTSQSALEVAARENASSDRSIYELKDLVHQIALKDKLDESRDFASRVQNSLFTLSARTNSKSKDRGVRKAPFVVLIGASMPSVLAEVGFVSNPKDEALMKKPEYRQKIAEALYRGIAQYASSLSHAQVARQKLDE